MTMIGESFVAVYSDQSLYVYHDKLKSWSTIFNQFSSANFLKPYILAGIDRNNETLLDVISKSFALQMEDNEKYNDEKYCIAFFMNKLSSVLFLSLKDEFMNTFTVFVRYLSDKNNEKVLKSLCEHVYNACLQKNDIYRDNIDEGGKNLLAIILKIIESNTSLQNVYKKYELYI